ncbi:MAG: tetratricopeptide repeat protein, partial [candidate division WOR-3 bacterium]
MRVVVDYASVVGQTFNLKVISRLCDLGAIDEEISDLVEMGYFLQTRPGDDPEYVFRNTLLKDVTYNALPLKKRKEIHQKTAQIIETTYRDRLQEFYELLAFHFLRADDFYKAINYYKLAGDKAKALFANDCALFSYSKVNEIMDLLSLRDEKYLELRLETSYNISEIYELIGEYDKMMAEAKSALEIIASRKDPRREAQFRELIGLSYIYLNRLKDAFENLNAALEINKSNNFLDLISSVYVDLGLLNDEEQNYEMAVYYYNLGYRVALDRDDSQATIKCLINLARLHKELGNYQLAIDYLKNALAYAVSHKNRRDEVLVKNYLGEVYLTIGDTNKANRYFKEAFTLASEISFIDMIITASANLSLINALLDNREPLRDWITYIDNRLNLGLSKETEITAELVRIYVILKLGWEDEASEKLRDLIEKCRSFGHKKAEVMSNLLMTQIDRKSINWARNALVLAEDINLPEYLWRSQYAMGQVLMVNGQSEAALDFFRKAYFILDDLKERLRDENLRQSFLSQPEYRHLTEILEEK